MGHRVMDFTLKEVIVVALLVFLEFLVDAAWAHVSRAFESKCGRIAVLICEDIDLTLKEPELIRMWDRSI